MKTQVFNRLVLLLAVFSMQMPLKAEQVKKIHKSWPVGKVNALVVENKFGNINFLSDRNDSVVIDVVVDADGSGVRRWNSVQDMIDFDFSFEEGTVSAETRFSEHFKTNQNFTIIYTIHIPVTKKLDVTNKFGNVSLGDLRSEGRFEVSYGNFFGNELQAPSKEAVILELKYGSATLVSVNHLKAEISYSKFKGQKIGAAEFDTRYSNIAVDECESLYSDSQYDTYMIGNLHTLVTDSKFTDWKIDEIRSDANFQTEYGDVKVGNIPRGFATIRIENSFGNIRLGVDKDAAYRLKSDCYFCDVEYPKSSPVKLFKENNHTQLETVVGTGSSNSSIIIESKYGKVDLIK